MNLKSIFLTAAFFWTSFVLADNYLTIDFVNNSGFDDEVVFLVVKGLDPGTGKDCFLQFDTEGVGACKATSINCSQDYSISAAQLKKLKIPKMASGRIYVSIGRPMDLYVNPTDLKIMDSDGFKPRDPNYYTLHDKVEFSYNDHGVWINPTAVDFFSLPLRIEQPGEKGAGFYDPYDKVLTTLNNVFATGDTTKIGVWKKLFIDYVDENHDITTLRVVSPGKAMVKGIPNTDPFDENYLNKYINAVWEYYQDHTLFIDASELKNVFRLDNYLFSGKVIGREFIFSNATGTYTEKILPPTHSTPIFAGAGGEFDHSNNTPKAIIIRQIVSAFEVGLLPAPEGTILNHAYFESQRQAGNYYQNNKTVPQIDQGPWYDLYSKAIHSLGADQPIYAFAYDDALGQDGTLHAENVSPLTITLGNMEGVKIPDPFTDRTKYRVEVLIGHKSKVEYQGRILKHGEILNDVTVPFIVKLNGQEASIYIKHPMARPYFDGADGIVIENTGKGHARISFPGK